MLMSDDRMLMVPNEDIIRYKKTISLSLDGNHFVAYCEYRGKKTFYNESASLGNENMFLR